MTVLQTGTPKTHVKTADSGATNHQVFCPECASPLYSTSLGDGPKMLNLRIGTARQRDQLPPRFQYWCRSAQPWAMELAAVRQLDGGLSLGLYESLQWEAAVQTVNFASQDTKEGIAAFVEKRAPVFRGR